jgi:hypothetical protein
VLTVLPVTLVLFATEGLFTGCNRFTGRYIGTALHTLNHVIRRGFGRLLHFMTTRGGLVLYNQIHQHYRRKNKE